MRVSVLCDVQCYARPPPAGLHGVTVVAGMNHTLRQRIARIRKALHSGGASRTFPSEHDCDGSQREVLSRR